MVIGLLQRSFVKLRGEFLQIVMVYRHLRECLLRPIEATERYISTGELRERLEFAPRWRGNYCVCVRLRPA
jgi:hypothetical protein